MIDNVCGENFATCGAIHGKHRITKGTTVLFIV
jgi:hypothetical protein